MILKLLFKVDSVDGFCSFNSVLEFILQEFILHFIATFKTIILLSIQESNFLCGSELAVSIDGHNVGGNIYKHT